MRKILFILFLLFSIPALGTTYYVKTGGNDAAAGTSDGTAWATIAKVNSMTFNPGDSILFNKGDTWREQLVYDQGAAGANKRVFYGNYGTGDNPRILASEVSASWTASGTTNVWQSTADFTNPMAASYYGAIYFELTDDSVAWGEYQDYSSGFGNLDKEYDWCYNASRIYVYAASDPDDRYNSIEIPQWNYCSSTAGNTISSYITIQGIDFHYALRSAIHPYYGERPNQTDFTVRYCNIGYIGPKGGGFAYGIEAYHSNFLVEYCNFSDCGRRAISFNFYEEPTDRGAIYIDSVVVRFNTFKRGYHTSSLDFATDNEEVGDTLKNIYYYGNIVDDSDINFLRDDDGSNQVYFQPYLAYYDSIYVYNNVFIHATMRNILITGGNHYFIYNNTVFDHNPGITTNVWGNMSIAAEAIVDVRNNIFYNNRPYSSAIDLWNIISDSKTEADVTWDELDYNLYYNPVQGHTGERGFMGGDLGYYDTNHWANFKSDHPGLEAHSPTPQVPHFADSASFDLTLKASSPAVDAGTPIWIVTTDILGNPRDASHPSLGAYEYGGVDSTATDILTFVMAEQTEAAVINYTNHTIAIEVLNSTDIEDISPTFTLSYGATADPLSGASQDFTDPVVYTVTALDGETTQEWTVTISVQEVPDLPAITTISASAIYTRKALATAFVTSDGGGTISQRGIVWSTSINPTTSDNKGVVNGTTGNFSATINYLLPNTTYHVRAYVTNESGTSYGDDVSFTTPDRSFGRDNGKIIKSNGKIVIVR